MIKHLRVQQKLCILLGCERLDYHEGVKNVWSVEMPKFVDYKKANKPKEKKTTIGDG